MGFLPFGSYFTFDFPGSIGFGSQHSIAAHFGRHGKEYTHEDHFYIVPSLTFTATFTAACTIILYPIIIT